MACRIGRVSCSLGSAIFRSPTARIMSTDESSEVLFKVAGNVGTISLNKPKALNAINGNMVDLITNKLLNWRSDDNIKIVYIQGLSPKAFCAGGDVVSITKDVPTDFTVSFFRREFQMNHLIGTYPKPYVALIHGIVMGGGVGLSVHGKYRVATDKSLYAMPETAIGYFPDVGGSYFLSRLPWPWGLFLGLTGHRLKGADLKHLGIATHYVCSEGMTDLKASIEQCKTEEDLVAVLTDHETPISSPFSLEGHRAEIEGCFGQPSLDAVFAALRDTDSEFTRKQLATLAKMSPRSLLVTHRLLSEARELSYEQCFRVELNASHEIVESGEFTEGVRALLIDKDNSPTWKPATLEEVTPEMLARYFERENTEIWQPL